ncbi:MAG: hypothetical protein J6333_10690 [Planctomycetes bacterium]|nr:hypothetical protein [Planctomycetota bacterium]
MVKFMSALAMVGALLVSGVCAAEAAKEEKSPLEGLKETAKVYVIGDNKTFHAAECPVIVKAKEDKKDVKEITFKQAKADAMKACKRCLDKSSKDGDEPKAEAQDKGGKKAEAEGAKKAGSKDEGGKKPEAEGKKKAKAE